MKSLILGILAALGTAPAFLHADDAPKPNIVFFLADDLRPDCLGILGHPIVKTPNVDKLLADGFIFRNAYVLGSNIPAVCSPSRTMIQTGQSYLRKKFTTPILAQTLRKAGYASIRSGKHGNGPKEMDDQFDRHLDGDNADGNADNLIRMIKDEGGKKPLFLYMAGHEPHDPQFAPGEYYAMYQADDIRMPENFLPFHPFNNGEMTVRDERTLPWPRTPENVGGKLARYYASTTWWDSQCGRVIAALKEAGQFDNTIFIVAGDNGLSLGEHGLIGKQNVYENGGMHVPLIFAGKGVPKGDTRAFAYLMDVYPTMCELAGIPVPEGLDARSLVPVIRGKQASVRDVMFTAYKNVQRSIRNDRWHLMLYPEVGVTQLFDLERDPHEMHNLADNPEYAGKIRELTAMMEETRAKLGDTTPLTVGNPAPATWDPSMATSKQKEEKARKSGKNGKADGASGETAE